MKFLLAKDVDLIALGEWLEENVGPVLLYIPSHLSTPTIPIGAPISKSRQWVFDMDFRKNEMTLEIDGRILKPGARVEFLLKFT